MTMTNATNTASDSIRYQRLLEVMDKALSNSKSQFDFDKAVKECYGDDASIFQGDGADNMLQTVLENLMVGVQDQVATDMHSHLKSLEVESKLLKLEAIIQTLEQQDAVKQLAEDADKQSARQALEQVRLPVGLSPSDLMEWTSFQKMTQDRDALQQDIASIQGEIQLLCQEKEQQSQQMNARLSTMKEAGKELEKAADVCSMMS